MFTFFLNIASGFLNSLENLDRWLFFQLNHKLTNPVFDAVFPWWRDQNTWLPLYLFLLLFVLMNFKMRAFRWIFFILVTVILTDQISSSILKDFFNRTRPCRDEALAGYVRFLVSYCPQSGSFTSSHAANHFGAAVFIHATLGRYFGKWIYAFYFWAASVCYAQVYVGVHYPGDVIGGAVLGTLVAMFTAKLFAYKNYSLEEAS